MYDPAIRPETADASSRRLQAAVQALPRETLWAFVAAAGLAQAGLFGFSLGVLLVGFRAQWVVGSALVGGGLCALVATVGVYQWHRTTT